MCDEQLPHLFSSGHRLDVETTLHYSEILDLELHVLPEWNFHKGQG